MPTPKAVDDFELTLEEDGSWTLRHFTDCTVQSRHSRLIDAIYERERLISGEVPPFGRWVINGFLHAHPLHFDGESDDLTQLDSTNKKTLHLRDWEYQQLDYEFYTSYQNSFSDDAYSGEFEKKFHFAVQQRLVAPLVSDLDESKIATLQQAQVNNEEDAQCATDRRPFSKEFPIIFWTIIGALLMVIEM
jgi:hypothetical protein